MYLFKDGVLSCCPRCEMASLMLNMMVDGEADGDARQWRMPVLMVAYVSGDVKAMAETYEINQGSPK